MSGSEASGVAMATELDQERTLTFVEASGAVQGWAES